MRSNKKQTLLAAILVAMPLMSLAQQTGPGFGGQPQPPAASTVPVLPGAVGHANTVEALLAIDSKLALEKLNEQANKALPPVPSNAPMAPVSEAPEVIEVLAILGIGEAKKASIVIDRKRHSQLVVGSKAGKYVVSKIGGGCVDLELARKSSKKAKNTTKKGAIKHVCYDPDAEYEQQPALGGGYASPGGGGSINTRMTIAPLPLPMVPAPIRVNPM